MTFAELCVRSGLCKSRNDARRLADQGGLYLGDLRITEADAKVPLDSDFMMLRAGKKRFMQVLVER